MRNCAQVHTSVLNLIFQQAKVVGVRNLSKWVRSFLRLAGAACATRVDVLEKDQLEVDPQLSPATQNVGGQAHHAWLRSRMLLGWPPTEVEELLHSDWKKALILRPVKKRGSPQFESGRHGPKSSRFAGPRDGAEFASAVGPLKALDAHEAISKKLVVTAVASAATGPAKSGQTDSTHVNGELRRHRCRGLRSWSRLPSLPRTRCRHFFACGVPPCGAGTSRGSSRLGTTSNNYVCHVRNCKAQNLSTERFDESVATQLAGAKKQRRREVPSSVEDTRPSSSKSRRTSKYNDAMDFIGNSQLLLSSCYFLLSGAIGSVLVGVRDA